MSDYDKHKYMQDTEGRLVPVDMVKDEDKLRDQLVIGIIETAKKKQADLISFKAQLNDDINSYMKLLAEKYNVVVGGKKGNLTLTSFDGRYKISRKIQDKLVFSEKLQLAKDVIDACVKRWAEGSNQNIVVLVQDAFKVDKEGKISTERVLGLRRLNIDDTEWQKAMSLIAESVQVSSSKEYVTLYEKNAEGEYKLISLDLAGL